MCIFICVFVEMYPASLITRHMERPGGPAPPVAAGGGTVFSTSDDSAQSDRFRSGRVGANAGGKGDGIGESMGDGSSLYDVADDYSCRPSQVPASAKRAAISPSLVNGWLFNAAREVAPPLAGPGPVACAYGDGIGVAPSSLPRELTGVGGPAVLFPLLQRAQTEPALCWTLRLIRTVVRGGGAPSLAYMQTGGGYLVLAGLLRNRRALLGSDTVRACFEMAIDRAYADDGCDAAVGGSSSRRPSTGYSVTGDDGGGSGGGNRDEDQPWGSPDGDAGGHGEATREGEGGEGKRARVWDWENELTFMTREEVKGLMRKAGVEEEEKEETGRKQGQVDGGPAGSGATAAGRRPRRGGTAGRMLCPFVLLTDPYALKNLVMNHQVSRA